MAWVATKPANNEKLVDTPAEIRANWDAIALGTDASLQITNAKVSASAGIVDTKLAEIGTANKVNATALKNLAGTPSGAGALPIANGGTGQTTASTSLTALLPTQTGNSGKALVTDASSASWSYPASLTIASATTGDLLYFNGTAWVRLAGGTSGLPLIAKGASAPTYETVGIAGGGTGQTTAQSAIDALLPSQAAASGKFLTSNGSASSWGIPSSLSVYSGSFTRAMMAANGDVSYTGVGFTPKAIFFISSADMGGDGASYSTGFSTGASKNYCAFALKNVNSYFEPADTSTAYSLKLSDKSGYSQTAVIKSFDADGFTLTWTKSGSTPPDTETIAYLAIGG